MAVAQGPFLAAVLLLVSSGLHCFSPLPACPESCTCQRAPLLNCSSSGLSFVPQHIQDSFTELDMSHNLLESVTLGRPHHNLRNVWLGNNSITHLSLCIERNLGSHYIRGRHLYRLRPWGKRGCVSWAPTLHLLSVERNQLEQLPEGLEGSESLQVLQLSFNKISTLKPADLAHLRQLKELHLQHNLITSLHPQMFQDLAQLRVIDLSFNMLTSLHPLMYLSLRNIGADVRLVGNRWQCDCSMHSVKRRMAYDSSRGLQAWSVVCASPSILSGRDLLQLEDNDLNCFSNEYRPEIHQDVTVYSGSEILLSCSTLDSVWWTPSGQASVSQPQAGLLISDVTERDTGLYVCVSEDHEVVSVFNLQISQIGGARRKTRSLPRTSQQIIPQDTLNRIGQERNQRANQSNLALAVCLSIFITFLIAFILGVLARPCIDVLWRRVTNGKRSSATNSVSSVEQRQYDNEAYSNGEEPEQIGTHRERRVTFSTVDFSNVQYYDTVASGDQESINNDAVIECEAAEAENNTHTAGDSQIENSLQQSSLEDNQRDGRDLSDITDAGRTHNTECEHIPDPVELEERRSLSSCSDSSLSNKVFNEDQKTQQDHTTLNSPQLAEDSVQQTVDFSTARKIEVPQISKEGRGEIHGFSSEPFADWSPHTYNTNLKDPDLWQENGEQFEFSDSVQSTSARSSSSSSFNDSKLTVAPTSDKQKRDDMSSSSSYVSVDEPTQYTVNSDQEEEDIEGNHNKPVNDYRYDTLRPALRPEHSFSSHSSDSDGEDYKVKREPQKGEGKDKSISVADKQSSSIVTREWDTREKVKPMPRTKWRVTSLGVTSKCLDSVAPSPPEAYSSSSSSESEAEITDLKVEQNTGRVNEGIEIIEPEILSTDLDRQCIPQIKRSLKINAPLPASDSSSSDDSTDETMDHMQKQKHGEMNVTRFQFQESHMIKLNSDTRWPALDLQHIPRTKSRLDIKGLSPASESSSSSDSEDDITHHAAKRRPGKEVSHDPHTSWHALDLEHIPRIKRHLDIKAPPTDSSSNSEVEEEKVAQIKKHEQGGQHVSRHPFQESEAEIHDAETRWPPLDLGPTMRIKRRLDIKAPSPPPDSSSNSEMVEEKIIQIKKHEQGDLHVSKLPFQKSQAENHDPETRWPALDLGPTMRIKRRLDIKAPSPPPDSVSSSDSEDEPTHHMKKQEQEQTQMVRLPNKVSQTVTYDPQTQWPALDLENTIRIKRRLDIKTPSLASDSSSSTDSEDQTKHHTEKPRKVNIIEIALQKTQKVSHDPDTSWPALDLGHTTRIKRCLDIKAPSPDCDSSSSSDSEDETTHHTEKPRKVDTAELALQKSQTVSHELNTSWPALDFENIPHIKRRLDIKAPSPTPDSSSNSEIVEEKIAQIKKHEQGDIHVSRLPFQESQAERHDPETRWPLLDLEHTVRIKRRLDIKAPSPPPDSSSNSDWEDETINHIQKQEQEQTRIEKLPIKVSQTMDHDPKTQWPALDLGHTTRIKRRLDIKAPSPDCDSSSSSDSEDETTHHTEKPRKVDTAELALQKSQTVSHELNTSWPALDFENIPHIKRRLDIKAPSPPPDSSSNSEIVEEKIAQIKKHEQGDLHVSRLPFQESQAERHDPETRWPLLDLEHTVRIKRRLDIKAPSPRPDSSSNSEIVEEKIAQIKKHEQGDIHDSRLPFQESQAERHDPETRWPLLDLEHTVRIKRRLDIKAPSPRPDSSSNSDWEDEKINHIKKQEQEQTRIEKLPIKVSQTMDHDPKTQWPALDLGHTTRIKRRLDIKAPSPDCDSSSSSDSEDETTHHTEKPRKVDTTELALQKSQTVSHELNTSWPALDFENIPHIKRRLDIKAPSPPPDSSSNSEIVEEKIAQIKKHEQGDLHVSRLPFQESQAESHDPETRWPLLDLEHTMRIKRRLDIKAPSPTPDSSSNSEIVEEKIAQIKKHEQGDIHDSRLPFQESQAESHDPETRWPLLDLEHTVRIKRRLDIKAPSPPPDSSSNSDWEDETINHIKKQEQEQTRIEKLPIKVSQTMDHDPKTQWPALDLGHTTRIKRRLDIKAPSPDCDSSSSSDSEDETTHHTEKPRKVDTAELALQKSQTVSHELNTSWPALDFENIPHIKRRLDIKAPSPPPDSSSNSEIVEEKIAQIKKHEQGDLHVSRLPFQESQAERHDPETRWPLLDLEHTVRIKRRLDIKAPSPRPDSSSNSEIVEEKIAQIKKHEQGDIHDSRLPFQESQAERHDPETRWPLLDLEHTVRIKRRLDIKAPSPRPDSSSNSDWEDEKINHIQKQEQEQTRIEKLPIKVSQTMDHDPKTQWPALDLGHTTRIKRRLDIKAPSPDCDSSSSSDSEDETTHHTEKPRKVDTAELALQKSQTVSHELNTSWPALDFENIPHIKRRLDIKAPSPPPDSSSNSEIVEEKIAQIKKHEQGDLHVSRLPFQESQAERHDPETRWPLLDLEHTVRIKRRLDIKAPSPRPDSSSNSEIVEEKIAQIKKHEQGDIHDSRLPFQESQAERHDPETRWPLLDLEHTVRIKRRLDIKAPSPRPDSSSNSDWEDEKINHIQKQEQEQTRIEKLPIKVSQTMDHDPKTQWPALDLGHTTRIKRRLDIKAPSPDCDSSSSSDSEDETTHHTEKPRKVDTAELALQKSQTVSHELNTSWPALDFENIPHIKRRLDIKAPSPRPDSSSNSEIVEEKIAQIKKHEQGDLHVSRLPFQESQAESHDPETRWPLLDLEHTVRIKRRLDIKAPSPQPNPILSSVFQGSQQSESNSFRSDSEDENRDHIKLGLGVSAISKVTGKEFIRSPKTPVINISHSPKAVHNIKLEKYTVITDEVGDKRSDNINTTPEINPELESRWATMNLGISRFRKRLEINQSHTNEPPDLPSSPPPDSPASSSNESRTGSKSSETRRNRRGVRMQGIIHPESSLTSENNPVNALSLKGQDDISGRSVEIKERSTKGYSLSTTEEKSKPNTMLTGFGIPHRRYLDIKISEKALPTPPLRQLSDSTSSSENEDASPEHAGKGWRQPVVTGKETSQKHTSLYVAQAGNIILDQSPGQTKEVERKAGVDLKSQTKVGEESDAFEWPRFNLTNLPRIRRALDIRAPLQRKASSSSNSENETIDHSVPDLSLGVPQFKTPLNFKAPLPEPSNSQSSCSESKNEVTNTSGLPDNDCLITYKRLIMKPLSPLSNSSSLSGQTIHHTNQRHMGAEIITLTQEGQSHSVGDRNESLAPRTVPSMSFDDVVKKSIEKSTYTTDVDLPPEIRWTGIGRQLSDLSISSPRRHQAPPAETELSQSADLPLMHENSSLSAKSDSIASSRALDKFENSSGNPNEILRTVSEDEIESKGLNALKVLSSKRQKWDKDENLDRGASALFDDHGSQGDTSFNYRRSAEDFKPLGKQPLTQVPLSSTSVGERSATDLLYSIPHYRSHDIEDIQPLQETPPDEAIGLTWGSPQSSKKGLEGSRSYLEQSNNLAAYFDSLNKNITDV